MLESVNVMGVDYAIEYVDVYNGTVNLDHRENSLS